MPCPVSFEILHRDATSGARVGIVRTRHGEFATPAFMPVGTRGAVKGLLPEMLHATGSEVILNNAYHLMLRPGSALIRQLGGVHEFMQWNRPILTDSGGYQAFSMADINSVDDDGVTFRSIIDGSLVRLTPEESIRVQNDLGADIIMAFDDCPPVQNRDAENKVAGGSVPDLDSRPRRGDSGDPRERLHTANDRTARWLERCVRAHARPDEQALFGIVQGGTDLDLRQASIDQICSIDLPGYAIGGVAVGEGTQEIRRVVEFTAPRLPENRPRYLMGVGYERDLLAAIRAGCDMFDCVLPTRNGRNGTAFTRSGRIQLKNARFRDDPGPVETGCDCPACLRPDGGHYGRAYLRHLFLSGEMLGPILLSVHNIRHFQRLMLDIRRAIRENDWLALAQGWPVVGGCAGEGIEQVAAAARRGERGSVE